MICEHCGSERGVGVHYCLHALKARADENWKLYQETVFQLNAAKEQRDNALLQNQAQQIVIDGLKGDIRAYEKNYDTLKASQAPLERELMAANRLNREYLDHIEWAWGIIANAGPNGCMGNWSKLDPEWVKIAENWRDKYHKFLDNRQQSQKRNHETRWCTCVPNKDGTHQPDCVGEEKS